MANIDASMILDRSTCVNAMDSLGAMPTTSPVPGAAEACCSTVTSGALTTGEAEQLARRFKALGDPTRVRLLSLIAAHPEREACICDLVDPVGLTQPTVSHYRLVDETLTALSTALRP